MNFIKKLFFHEACLVLESLNVSFISIIKINGHLLVNFLIETPFKIAIIYDLYQGAVSECNLFSFDS